MSEQAANPTTAPNAAPNAPLHAGQSFHEFQQQVQDRLKVQREGVSQPPAAKPNVVPQAKSIGEVQQRAAEAAAAELDPNAHLQSKTIEATPNPEAEQPPAEQQQQPPPAEGQVTPEDLDLLAKVKAWMSGEGFPEDLLAKLPVPLKNGEQIEYETLDEVRQGRMRQRDYTRQMQQLQEKEQQYIGQLDAYKQHFEAIFSDDKDGAAGGEAMYEIYTRQGKRKQLLALGAKLAQEEQQDIDAANGMGYAVMQRLGIKDPRDHRVQEAIKTEWHRRQEMREGSARQRALEFENQRLKQAQEQRQQQNANEAHWATQRKRLEQLRPRAFEALGLNHENPKHQDVFQGYLGAIIRQEGANEVTPAIVMKAARATKEELAELGARGADPKPQPKTFQPQIQGGAGGKVAGAKPKQWDAESFAQAFKLRSW